MTRDQNYMNLYIQTKCMHKHEGVKLILFEANKKNVIDKSLYFIFKGLKHILLVEHTIFKFYTILLH